MGPQCREPRCTEMDSLMDETPSRGPSRAPVPCLSCVAAQMLVATSPPGTSQVGTACQIATRGLQYS